MAVKLAAVETAAVFGAVCAMLFWAVPTGLSPQALAAFGLALALCSLLAFYCIGLYDLGSLRRFGQCAQRLPWALSLALLPLMAGQVLLTPPTLPHGALAWSVLAALATVLAVRAGTYRLLESRPLMERVLVVGGSWLAQELVKEIHARPALRQCMVGMIDDGGGALPAGCRRLGCLGDLASVVEQVRPHRVIVALAARRGRMPLKALLNVRLRGIAVEDGVEVYETLTGKIAIEALTPTSLIFSKEYRVSRLDLALARALGLPAIAALLLLLAPVFALIGLAIKLDSRGPVLVVQERVGLRGRRFRLVKFRTMHPLDGELPLWFRDNGDRITRLGRWLRKFRVDELPQLINIIQGDMNLVGPRPQRVPKFELLGMVARNTPECGEQIPYYALRSLVRPGMTGWAQVRYRYAHDLEEEIEKMRYDLYYIKHRSPWLDLRILLETIKIVLRGREAGAPMPALDAPNTGPARAPRRLAANATPLLELGLAPVTPIVGSAERGASLAPGPALVGQDVRKA